MKELLKWSSYERLNCFPSKCNCEPMRIGELVLQPLAVITSIPYSVVGYLTLRKLDKENGDIKLKILAWVFIFQGFASAFLHSSFISYSRYMDWGAIFAIFSWLNALVIFKGKSLRSFLLAWLVLTFIPTYVLSMFKDQFIIIFLVYAGISMYFLRKHMIENNQTKQSMKYLKTALGLLLIGGLCFLMDLKRLFCVEEFHLYGHSFWHILTALSMYQIFNYFLLHQETNQETHEETYIQTF